MSKELQEKKTVYDGFISQAALPPLSDASFAIATDAIANEGMLCLAPAGCGKSVLLKQI